MLSRKVLERTQNFRFATQNEQNTTGTLIGCEKCEV